MPRLRWPLLVLLVSIGLTGVAATEAQRTARSQRAVADRALAEYASFAAWSFGQHLADTLAVIEREVVGAVNHGDNLHTNPDVPRASELSHYLPWSSECACMRPRTGVTPDAFFAIRLGHPGFDATMNEYPNPAAGWRSKYDMRMAGEMDMSMDVGMSASRSGPAVETTSTPLTYSRAEQTWVVDSLTRRIRHLGEPDHGFTLVVGRTDKTPRFFAYTLMPTAWGDTMVYGARYAPESMTHIFDGVLDGPALLPATFTAGRRTRDIVAVRIRDRAGNSLFDSAPGVSSPLAASVTLPSRAGLLSVEAIIRPEIAGTLLIGGLPQSRLPFLFGLLGLAAALSIVAVMQLRREGELARLRAGFVSSVSHELRTPVAQIRLYLETLQLGRASTEEQRQWSLDHIERETTRLSHLVENVLRFSSLGSADPSVREPVDVAAEVRRIVEEYTPLASSRRTTFVVDAEPCPSVMLRHDALRHIVLNLLDNAVKYGPSGQAVRVVVEPRNGGVQLTVDDAGPGVPPADRERIWRAFARGANTPAQGGSGIGLTVVREVVQAHGGETRVDSSPAGGARFVVWLPATPIPSEVQ
ncbi:MAG TPA: HAMP domain-containing sensor histidine kinase [Gemmatimonadaceae bacterium]